MGVGINQYDIFWVDLDPTKGSEIRKTRPCLIISPNEMNHNIRTLLIAPLTTKAKNYPTRIKIQIHNKSAWIVLDQVRCIDKVRLMQRIGHLETNEIKMVKKIIKEMLVD